MEIHEPEECCQFPGFYYYPFDKTYVISRDGRVINVKAEEVCNVHILAGYPCVSGVGYVHRAIMETFEWRPDSDTLDVNHKDGIKTNSVFDNLEWATRSENCIHAYQTGLRNDNTPLKVKDLRTEIVQTFYSLNACARYFGVGGSRIHQMLQVKNHGKVVFNYYVIIREGAEWPNTTVDDIGKFESGRSRPVVVTYPCGKKIAYGSLTEAERNTGISRKSIAKVAWMEEPPTLEGYKFSYQLTPNKPGRKSENQGGARRKPIPVDITYPTGEVKRWPSAEEFALIVGTNKNTLQKAWGRSGHWNGYKATYVFSPT